MLKDKVIAEDQESNALLVEQSGENLVLCLGNLLNSASQKTAAETNQTEGLPSQVRNKGMWETIRLRDNSLARDIPTLLSQRSWETNIMQGYSRVR